MPLFIEQCAKVVEADGRNLYIFDVDAVNGKEGVDQDNVHKEFCQYGMGWPLIIIYCKPKSATFIFYGKR